MRFYLTSVSSCLDQIESFKSLINSQTNLVILPFSYHKDYINCSEDIINHFDRTPSNKESIFWSTARPFINAGINPDRIVVINQYNDPIELIKYKMTRPNTIIYLPGGFPENIVSNIYKFGLYSHIKNCSVIVGESAGSMAPFTNFFVYPDSDYEQYDKFKGLRLLSKMTIIPHFTLDNEGMLDSCAKFQRSHPKTKIYCVQDGGYVVIDNNKIIETNKIWIYKKPKRKIIKVFKQILNKPIKQNHTNITYNRNKKQRCD